VRLEPIEKPKGLMMRIAFWMTRRQFGKVMTPMKVLYPRMPRMMKLSYEIVKFETKGIRLDVSADVLPPLTGDAVRLGQLLDNLVSNAIKFTPAGGQVTLSLTQRDDLAVFEVADTGMG